MARKPSSRRWLDRQASDPYVKKARAEGWRSRAVFKLEEIHQRERLLRPGMTVVDLGAAPGGWSQFAAGIVGDTGQVFALDLLPMDPLQGVEYIRGDFADEKTLEALVLRVGERGADLVLSDMAPNISGVRSVDQPRALLLAELALDAALKVLRPGGSFVCKLFHGEGFDEFVREARQRFERVSVRKPASSRPGSRETYLVARTYRI
jgi:23S rRNA (uridine2552-2'-O)-methyltransferase